MLKEHAKLIHALVASGEVTGRKKLQKMIFIAKKMKFPFQEKFQFHFYGPYSEELTLQIEELCNMGFIEETKEEKGNYFQYRYEVIAEGKKFLETFEEEMPSFGKCFEDMNAKSSRFLELVSTVMYFDDLTREEVCEKIEVLKKKQNYSQEEIAEAYDYIQILTNMAPSISH
jgi:uncharacterized protein YwgA